MICTFSLGMDSLIQRPKRTDCTRLGNTGPTDTLVLPVPRILLRSERACQNRPGATFGEWLTV